VKVTGPAEAVSWPVIADPDVLGGIVSFRTLRPYSVAIFPYIASNIGYIYIYVHIYIYMVGNGRDL
jgi:hypothetical protein